MANIYKSNYTGQQIDNNIAKINNINEVQEKLTSINGLAGGILTSSLIIQGGDQSTASKIALNHNNKGQITDSSTATLFGFIGDNNLTIGSNTYNTVIRGGSGSAIGGKLFSNLAQNSDIKNGILTIKLGTDGTVTATGSFSANQETDGTITLPVYSKEEVNEMIIGAVQYLGSVNGVTMLNAKTPNSRGDFCRVTTNFQLPAEISITNTPIDVHASDILICELMYSSGNKWSVVHGENWQGNTKTTDGYVTAGGYNFNKVWKTDSSGVPGWRDDANTEYNIVNASTAGLMSTTMYAKLNGIAKNANNYSLPIASTSVLGGVKSTTTGTTADRTYYVEVAADGTMKVNVPWVSGSGDVTAAGNNTFSGDNNFTGPVCFLGTDSVYFSSIINSGYGISGTNYSLKAESLISPETCRLLVGGQTAGANTTSYGVGKIVNKQATLTLPTTSGTLATTDDISGNNITVNGTHSTATSLDYLTSVVYQGTVYTVPKYYNHTISINITADNSTKYWLCTSVVTQCSSKVNTMAKFRTFMANSSVELPATGAYSGSRSYNIFRVNGDGFNVVYFTDDGVAAYKTVSFDSSWTYSVYDTIIEQKPFTV